MPSMQANPYNAGSMPYANQAMYRAPELNKTSNMPPSFPQNVYPPPNVIKYQGTNLSNSAYNPRPQGNAIPQPRPGVPFVNPVSASPFDVKAMQPNSGMAGSNIPPRLNPSPTSESQADDKKKRKIVGTSNEPDNKKIKKEMPPGASSFPQIPRPIQQPIQYIPRPVASGSSGQVTYQLTTSQPAFESDLVSPDVIEQEDTTAAVQGSEAEKEAELAKQLIRDSLITRNSNTRATRSSNANTATQDDWNIMTYDDIGMHVVNVLASTGVTIEEDAVFLLMKAIQSHVSLILQVAISFNKKRLNKTSIGYFSELSKIQKTVRGIESAGVDVDEAHEQIDELLTNHIGLKWGPDTRKALLLEDSKKNEHLRRMLGILEDSVLQEIREYNSKQAIQIGNKRIETSTAPKWVHDEYCEKQGDLSWEEIVISRVRGDAAKKNNMLVPTNKRPYAASSTETTPQIRNFPEFIGVATDEELVRGNDRCPLLADGSEISMEIKIDDIAAAIAKMAQSKAGGPLNHAFGTSLRRYNADI